MTMFNRKQLRNMKKELKIRDIYDGLRAQAGEYF